MCMCLSCLVLSLERSDGRWQRRHRFLRRDKEECTRGIFNPLKSAHFCVSKEILSDNTFDGETRSPASCVVFPRRMRQFALVYLSS